MEMTRVAFVDESIRADSAAYVMAAIFVSPHRVDELRHEALRFRLGAVKPRWSAQQEQRRAGIYAALQVMDFGSIAVSGRPLQMAKQERAQTQCLKVLLGALEAQGIGVVCIERRGSSLDLRDVRTIDRLRGRRQIGRDIRIEFGDPKTEPALWLADFVSGISADAITSLEPDRGILQGTHVIDLALR